MNVLALLEEELKGKNWTVDEKKRYLYLRSCEIFSYDPRYFLYIKLPNGEKIQEQIRNQKINLEEVNSTWTVCSSFAESVYSVLLKELLQEDCEVNKRGSHGDITMKSSDNTIIKVDPTYNWDYTRVKMGLSTYGYVKQAEFIGNFEEYLKEQDETINYLVGEYKNQTIKKQAQNLYQEYLSLPNLVNKEEQSDDFMIYRMQKIKDQIDTYTNMSEFSDLKTCITYMQRNYLLDDFWTKVATIPLYQAPPAKTTPSPEWEFVNLYAISLKDDMLYYALAKNEDHYTYQEITKSDAISYTKNYQGENKCLIYHM